MKANNGSGNCVERDEWETPQELFDNLNKQYRFDFDCCANSLNNKAYLYSNNFEGYYPDPKYICWMNPPFSKVHSMFLQFFSIGIVGVAIYRCDNLETKTWQDVILLNADWIFIPRGRVCYEGMNGSGSRFPSALIGVGVEPPKHMEGVCLKTCRVKSVSTRVGQILS